MVCPLVGRGNPDGSLGGASEIASIRRVSALAEKAKQERQNARISSFKWLLNMVFTSLSFLDKITA
jgi:hypothetical protein